MRNKWRWLLLAITGIFFLMFGPPLVSQARDVIEASGNDANSAIIKDSNGTIISHDAQLPADQDYTVNYNWRIPNNVKITAGDTMTFQIPENVQITTDRSFPMNGFIGGTIGTFNLAAGSHTGIVTFNQAYQIATMNRSGYVRLTVKGTVPSQPSNTTPIALEKSAAWVDASDPRRIDWTVHVLANNNTLVNPTFTDTLSNNHEYVANSASLKEQDGTVIPVTTTATGQQVTFAANGRYLKDLILTYQTKTNQPDGKDTFENSVNYQDSNDNSGHAEASIDRLEPDVPEEPNVTEPQEPGDEDNPGTEEPGTEKPGTEEPGTEEPGTEQPGTEEPGTEEPGTEEPGTEEPGTEQPGTEEPGTEEPGTEEPGTEEPGTEQPGTEEPGTEEPGTEEPGTEEPGTEQPGTEEPGTEEPGTENPNVEKPEVSEPKNPGAENSKQPSIDKPNTPSPLTTTGLNTTSGFNKNTLVPSKPTNQLPATATAIFDRTNNHSNQSLPQTDEHPATGLAWLGLVVLLGLLSLGLGTMHHYPRY